MPQLQPLFKDIAKRVNDLLSKDFPSQKQENRVEWKGQASRDVTVEANMVQKKDGSIVGTLEPKYKLHNFKSNVSTMVNTRREAKAEVEIIDLATDGLKATVGGEHRGEDNYTTLAIEYRHELASVTASADYGKSGGSTIKLSGLVGSQGFSLGSMVDYLLGAQESRLRQFDTAVNYSDRDYDITVFGRMNAVNADEDKNELGISYFHKINPMLSVGTEVVFDVSNSENNPKLMFGGQYRLREDSLFKGKFDTDGKVGLGWIQNFNENVKFTLSSSVDVNNLNGKGASTFGFSLSVVA